MLIPICFATDDAYAPYCGVAISSLIAHGSPENEYKIFILYERLSKINISRLQRLSVGQATVECMNVRQMMDGNSITEQVHLSIATVYRLLACELFSSYEKLLYLDSDIVVTDDVAKLFSVNIDGMILGAVHGSLGVKSAPQMKKYLEEVLGIDTKNFFNAGVLLFNVKMFLQEQVGQKALSLLDSRDDLIYMDQCALNILCEGRVAYLERYWNYEFVGMDDDYAMQVIPPSGIYHFDGDIKPWHDAEVVGADIFWHSARNTFFYEEILYRMNIHAEAEVSRLFHLLSPYRKIAVYGAGYWGCKYVHWLQSAGFHKIIIWVDRAYDEKQDLAMRVRPIKDLLEANFEVVLISVADTKVCEEICKYLVQQGIDESKCIWFRDRRD